MSKYSYSARGIIAETLSYVIIAPLYVAGVVSTIIDNRNKSKARLESKLDNFP